MEQPTALHRLGRFKPQVNKTKQNNNKRCRAGMSIMILIDSLPGQPLLGQRVWHSMLKLLWTVRANLQTAAEFAPLTHHHSVSPWQARRGPLSFRTQRGFTGAYIQHQPQLKTEPKIPTQRNSVVKRTKDKLLSYFLLHLFIAEVVHMCHSTCVAVRGP